MYIGGAADDVVGNTTGDFTQNHTVLAIGAVASHHIKTFFFGNFEHAGQVAGVILQVAIHGGDVFALGIIDSGHEGQTLAVVLFQLHHPQARMLYTVQFLEGIVLGSVIHKYHFVFVSLHCFSYALNLRFDVFFFVVDTNDN